MVLCSLPNVILTSQPGFKEDIFVTWGWFEDYILNSFFAFTSKSGNREFKTRFFSTDDIFDEQKNVVRNESTKCKLYNWSARIIFVG